MRTTILFVLFFISTALALGQVDSNSVTVTASRNANLQADQVVFGVFVDTPLSGSLDDALAALQGSGITAANFSEVSTVTLPPDLSAKPPAPPMQALEWTFGLAVPFSKFKDTVAALAGLQQGIASKKNGLALNFQVQGTYTSAQLLQSQSCSVPDLIADARVQAQKLASAAGLNVGAVLGLSSFTSNPVPNNISISRYSSVFGTSFSSCSVTVKFALVRFQ